VAADGQAGVALRNRTVGLKRCLGDHAKMAGIALRDVADSLTCGALRHAAVSQLLWEDALLWLLAGFVMMAGVALRDAADGLTSSALRDAALPAGFAILACSARARSHVDVGGSTCRERDSFIGSQCSFICVTRSRLWTKHNWHFVGGLQKVHHLARASRARGNWVETCCCAG
jgi:hypothetical protein